MSAVFEPGCRQTIEDRRDEEQQQQHQPQLSLVPLSLRSPAEMNGAKLIGSEILQSSESFHLLTAAAAAAALWA